MKAILVIDMPKSCDECPLNYDYMDCMGKDTHIELKFEQARPIDCPLRPMPQKYVERDRSVNTEKEVEAFHYGLIIGRNALIDEIMGEEE